MGSCAGVTVIPFTSTPPSMAMTRHWRPSILRVSMRSVRSGLTFDDDIRCLDFKGPGVGDIACVDGSFFTGGFIEVLVKRWQAVLPRCRCVLKIADLVDLSRTRGSGSSLCSSDELAQILMDGLLPSS